MLKIYETYNNACSKDRAPEEIDEVLGRERDKWAKAASTLTDKQVMIAIEYFKNNYSQNNNWVPNERRFVYKAHGLLDNEDAFIQRAYDHPSFAVRKAFNSVPSYERKHYDEKTLRRAFLARYEDICNKIIAGKIQEEPIVKRLEVDQLPATSRLSKEEQRAIPGVKEAHAAFVSNCKKLYGGVWGHAVNRK